MQSLSVRVKSIAEMQRSEMDFIRVVNGAGEPGIYMVALKVLPMATTDEQISLFPHC